MEPIVNAISRKELKYLFKCDAAKGYWAVKVAQHDAYKTALPTHLGQLCYLRVGMGLTGPCATCSMLKDTTIGPIPSPNSEPALDRVNPDVFYQYFQDDDCGGATTAAKILYFFHSHYFTWIAWAQ